jgi:urea transporter
LADAVLFMKTCSMLLMLATLSSCLSIPVSAEVEQNVRRYSLKYVTANAALRTAFESLSALDDAKLPGLADGKPAPLSVAVGATKLTSDPRTNALTVASNRRCPP